MEEHRQKSGQENKKSKKKILRIILIVLCVLPVVILINFYLDAKYRKREYNMGNGPVSIVLTDQEFELQGECFGFYFQGYDAIYIRDSIYLTIYVTQLPQNQDSSDEVLIHWDGNFSKSKKVYLCYRGIETLVYER